ncbi:MAG: hypothetical protein F6K24_46205 [Okeania sp. SIO2D1]|nr:hypothetical protein [Okeania sp. SIO2D1]
MLQDTQAIRHYQKLTDSLVDFWDRGYRYNELRMYVEGYLSCLRQANVMESYLIHRLEEDAFRFLRDPSNFELAIPQPQVDRY